MLEGSGDVPALRRAGKRKPKAEQKPRKYQLSDYGNAERLKAVHGEGMRFVHEWARWIIYDGARWGGDRTGLAMQRAKSTVRQMWDDVPGIADANEKKQTSGWIIRSESAPALGNMIRLAEDELPIVVDELDRDPWLWNCPNGTIDLRTGERRPHRRSDFITKMCPVEFDPDARCDLFDQFMRQVFEDNQNLIGYLRRYFGYCLTGHVSEQMLQIFFGSGANGKSTFLNTLLAVYGPDYAMQAVPDLLMMKSGDAHPTERADLFGRRFVSCVETEDGRALAESLVKQLTGGEKIRARRMRENFWEFDPQFKLVLCSNHKPRVRGTDHGIWRRLRLVPFNVRFSEEQQDKTLTDKLRAELPGILAWCVRGCLEWQRDGLQTPDEVQVATKEYRSSEDLIQRFIADECLQLEGIKTKAGDLYSAFGRWCEVSGERRPSQRKFGEAISQLGIMRMTSNGTWYSGIGLRSGDDE